ncbi:Protein FAR1-RELATED SEQUENCE 11 [Bienertia sinuspersici]
MPSTKHSFCIWHITSKFSCWFATLLRDDYQTWCGQFYKLYKMTNPKDFEEHWPLMVAKYNMEDIKHIQGLYKTKTFWAHAYLRDNFLEDDNYQKIGEYKCVYQASPLEEQVFRVFTPFAFKKFQEELTGATL